MKRIFVSSTFKDMQNERDLFHTVITPKLNTYAREYGESVSFCDLRWGVNTGELESEEGARKVLSVCLNEIDRCKPYMIVLLGDRYGWVPDKKLIKDAADRKNFAIDDVERSVTALEIEYGALSDNSQLSRTLFYFREFEDSIPEEYKSINDTDAARLKELKDRIIRIAGDRVRTYKVKASPDGKTLRGLDTFADTVVSDIREMMEDEWKEYANLPLYEKINRSQWNIVKEKSKDFIVFHEKAEELKNEILSNNHIIVSGADGSGKTTMMSYIATKLENEGYDVLPIFCCKSRELDSKKDVLRYVMSQIEVRLNCNSVSDNFSSDQKTYSSVIQFQDEADIHKLDTIINGTVASYYSFENRKANGSKSIKPLYGQEEAEENEYELQQQVFDKIQTYDRTQKRPLFILIDDSDKLDLELLYNKDVYFASVYHVEHSIHICSFFNENNLKSFNSLCRTFKLTSIGLSEKESLIKGILNNYGKELSPKVITLISSKIGSSSPKYIGTVLRRLEIMDKADFDIINAYGDGNDAIIARQIELVRDIPENYYEFLVYFMIETAKYFGDRPLLEALEYLALWEHGLSIDFWKKWMQKYGIIINSLDFSLYINYAQNLIDVFDDHIIRFSSNTLRRNFIEHSNNISLKYSKAIDYLVDQNCFFTPEYSYDITKMLIALERNEELADYIMYAMSNWNKKQRETIALGIHDAVSTEKAEKIFTEWISQVGKKDCLRLINLVHFLSDNLYTIFGQGEREVKKKLLSLGIKEISAYSESEQGIYGMQILAECYKGIGHTTMKEIQDHRPGINNYRIAEQWSKKEIEAIDFYRKAVELEHRVTSKYFSKSNAYWYYCCLSNLVLYQIELFKRYHRYIPEQMNKILDESLAIISDYISLTESNLPSEDNKSLLEDLKTIYGYSRRIFECKGEQQNILLIAEKEFEIAEKIKPDYHFDNVSCLFNAYLSVNLNDDNMERVSDLFAQRVNYVNVLLRKSLETKQFKLFAAYLLECESLLRCIESKKSVLLKTEYFFVCFESILLNLIKAIRSMNQIDQNWDKEDTGSKCFYKIKTIIEYAVKIYDAENSHDTVIALCNDLLQIMKYEYQRFESQKTNPDYTHFTAAFRLFAKQLAKGDINEKEKAIELLEECLSFIETNKNDSHLGKYGDETNQTVQNLVDVHLNIGNVEHLNIAIVLCDKTISLLGALSDNALPLIPLFMSKIKAFLLLDADKHIDQILECIDITSDILISSYNESGYKLWTALYNKWLDIVNILNQAIEKTSKDKHSLIHSKIVEWLTLWSDRGLAEAQYLLAESYYRGLHEVAQNNKKAYELYLSAAKQDHALSQYFTACLIHLGQGVEKDDKAAYEWFKKAADNGVPDAMASLGGFYLDGIGVEKDYAQALKYLTDACKHGNPLAHYNLAVMYYNGFGVEQNYETALSLFEKAASHGFTQALRLLARIYKNGNIVPRDLAKSFEWYLKLAETNDADAQYEVANAYYYGRGVDLCYEKALEWYLKSAQNGNLSAQYNVGLCYKLGKGCDVDYTKAFEWFMKAAMQGDKSSQCEVAYAYYYGIGVAQSYEKAFEWYLKSAQNGNSSSQYNVGLCYKHGKGCDVDYTKAFEWFMKAAMQGDKSSQCEVGHAYYYGRGVNKSYEKAVEWYLKSANGGNKYAQYALGLCYKNEIGTEQDYAKAFEWFMKAADQGMAHSQCEVGYAYYFGKGVDQSYEKAAQYFMNAALQGHAQAQKNIACCYEEGTGVEQNLEQALIWYKKSADQGNEGAAKALSRLTSDNKL